MDSFLIALVVMAIAALSNWLQRRAQANEEQPPPPRPQGGPRPPPQGTNAPPSLPGRPVQPTPTIETSLERELRRLLGGELGPKAPPPPPAPVSRPTPTPPAAPARPPVVVAREPSRTRPAPPILATIPAALAAPPPAPLVEAGDSLRQAAVRHLTSGPRARKEAERVAASRAARGTVIETAVPLTTILSRIRRDPNAARQAFVASLIFGRPKGQS